MPTYVGPWDWKLTRDREGHRIYELFSLVQASNTPPNNIEDPSEIIDTPGLPAIGSSWADLTFITGGDVWAVCVPDIEVSPYEVNAGEAPEFYLVKNTFTTEPLNRCQDNSIENPLNEPHDISGSWVNKRKIPHQDRDGKPYRSTTGEPLFGAETEIDDSDYELNLGFNVASLNMATVNSLMHHLNNSTLWGLPAEKIKFSKFSFARKLYGTCNFYYALSMGFNIRDDWTQYLADKGRVQLGSGGNSSNPEDWVVMKDKYGENMPLMRLDIQGKPIVSGTQTPSTIVRKPYPTGNLLLLGVPTFL